MLKDESGHVVIGHAKIPYSIRRSTRRRRSLGLLVGREGEIRILAPARMGFGVIEKFLQRQQRWIHRRLDSVKRHRAACPELRFEAGAPILYRGEGFTLRVTAERGRPQGCAIGGEALIVNLPDAASSPGARREEIRLEIMLWYKKQARDIFKQRADYWSDLAKLRYRRLNLSAARRQWGSCSAGNDVRLNWRLILTPPALLDYVIVHELCHIPHKNHSRRFWRAVEAIIPDWKMRRRELHKLDPGDIFSQAPESE